MKSLLVSTLLILLIACSPEHKYELAQDFTLIDAESIKFSLSEYKGKPVVIIFWATWCPYCAKVMPSLENYYQQYKTKNLAIIAINIMEDGDPISHMKQYGFNYRLGLNGDSVAEKWHVTGTPTLFFINKKGEVVAQNQISNPESPVIRQLIEQIID